MKTEPQSSIGEIRIRLFLLLGRAFVIVLGLSVVFFLVGVSYLLTAPPNRLIMPSVNYLEGYYLGHGSWEGVETVFQGMQQPGFGGRARLRETALAAIAEERKYERVCRCPT